MQTTRVALTHRVSYAFGRRAVLSPYSLAMLPSPHARAKLLSHALRVAPGQHFINWLQDVHGCHQARLVFLKEADTLELESSLLLEAPEVNPFDFVLHADAARLPLRYAPELALDLQPFLRLEPPGPAMAHWLGQLESLDGRWTVEGLLSLSQRVQGLPGPSAPVSLQPSADVEALLSGQGGGAVDRAWLLALTLRHLGVATRLAVGYLLSLGDRVTAALHAWTEAFLPGAGWVGVDATTGLLTTGAHVPLTVAATPSQAPLVSQLPWTLVTDDGLASPSAALLAQAPTMAAAQAQARAMGLLRPTDDLPAALLSQSLIAERQAAPLGDDAPFTSAVWRQIEVAGHAVDRSLAQAGVTLSASSSPTFCSALDRASTEWTVGTLGPSKRQAAERLARRLCDRFSAQGGLVLLEHGPWFPGDLEAHWRLSALWRRDGQPAWRDRALLADAVDLGHGVDDARRLAMAIAQQLGVEPAYALPAYEDLWLRQVKARVYPGDLDPFEADLADERSREELAQLLDRQPTPAVGYVLPLHADDSAGRRWRSGLWSFRSDRLHLTPGGSPVGLRLPLDSLAWAPATDRATAAARPALDAAGPLPDLGTLDAWLAVDAGGRQPEPRRFEPAPRVPRTALCVEARLGRLFVFLPPTPTAESFLALALAVERACAAERLPVCLEGYGPPADPRLDVVGVEPQPGCLRVRGPMASSWAESCGDLHELQALAAQDALTPVRMLRDGRLRDPGGEQSLRIGGVTPADSPFLRRPELLRSLIAYLNDHPSLSFCFAGGLVGPAGSAPRQDQARHDSLYELEVALRHARATVGAPTLPWTGDRQLRFVLANLAGETGKVEASLERLYPPLPSADRLGEVELRAFFAGPHPQSTAVQHLLVRAVLARLAKAPRTGPLRRWGAQVDDLMLLPHALEADLAAVVDDLNEHGVSFELAWLAPQLAWRFPTLGRCAARGVELELRQAVEPVALLSEQPGPGGAVRYVDESMERLQARLVGLTPTRHTLLCDGRPMPLSPTGRNAEAIAAVRYRAQLPPARLHPAVFVHSPLAFEVVDLWQGEVILRCDLHVLTPQGTLYESWPLSATEAARRRAERFVVRPPGGQPSASRPAPAQPSVTLDLRSADPIGGR